MALICTYKSQFFHDLINWGVVHLEFEMMRSKQLMKRPTNVIKLIAIDWTFVGVFIYCFERIISNSK